MSFFRMLGRTTARGVDVSSVTGFGSAHATPSLTPSAYLKGASKLCLNWVMYAYASAINIESNILVMQKALSTKYPNTKLTYIKGMILTRTIEHKTVICKRCSGDGCSQCRQTGRGIMKIKDRCGIIGISRRTYERHVEHFELLASDIDMIIIQWESEAVKAMKRNIDDR